MGNAMGGGVRDGVRGFVSRTGPDSQLSVRLAQDEQLLRSLKAAGTDIDDCLKWIELAKGRLQGGPIRRYFDYDVAWACILRVRHRLCSLLPIDQLYRVAIDVGNDLSYIRDPRSDSERYCVWRRSRRFSVRHQRAARMSSGGHLIRRFDTSWRGSPS